MVRRDGNTLVTPTVESAETESDEEVPRPFQVDSYRHLLRFPVIPATAPASPSGHTPETGPVVDAIIVPTIRSAEQLRPAVELAAHARSQLVVLCTDRLPDGLSSDLAKLKPGMATELTMSADIRHHRLGVEAATPDTRVSACAIDISRKRNLGLLIGRACGWHRMLFLDDDIRRLNAGKLKSAATLLDRYPVVGLQVNKYPDASVVGHARRLIGRRQEPFISGGSLLVNPQRMQGFFPAVYHEDWLCIIDHLRFGEVAIGGQVGQLAYQPFTTPERAQLEEFGDTLASGLLWLVHSRETNSPSSATDNDYSAKAQRDYWNEATKPRFWEKVLSERVILLDNIAARLPVRHHHLGPLPLESVKAARERCGELSQDEFVSFMDKWLSSLDAWRTRMSEMPAAESVAKALTGLGLAHVIGPHESPRRRVRAPGARQWLARASTQGPASAPDGIGGPLRGLIDRQRRRLRDRTASPGS